MHKNMTDEELKESMRHSAKLAGIELSEERIEADLAHFKGHLAAIDTVGEVPLKREDDPIPTFKLEPGS